MFDPDLDADLDGCIEGAIDAGFENEQVANVHRLDKSMWSIAAVTTWVRV